MPKKILEQIPKMQSYDSAKNIRLMRYDFHPDINGKWVVTEVNSDVPGGFAESSLLPDLARKTINIPGLEYTSFGEKMVKAINNKLNKKGTIMMVHCTCFSDDRQVMQYMGDRLKREGYKIIYGAADHINFKEKQAYCILDNNKEKIDLIFRFTPLEWYPAKREMVCSVIVSKKRNVRLTYEGTVKAYRCEGCKKIIIDESTLDK